MRNWIALSMLVAGALTVAVPCQNPTATTIPPTQVQYFIFQDPNTPSFINSFFQTGFSATSNGFLNGAFPFGQFVTCPGLPTPNTVWPIGTPASPSNLLVRFNIAIPSTFTGNNISITVDNDLIAAWANGIPVAGFSPRDNCGPVSTPIVISIPIAVLHPGDNLIALWVKDRGVQSFLDVSFQSNLCPDNCTVAAAHCRFVFSGHLNDVPIFLLGNIPDGPGFTTQVIARNATLTISDMNANFKPQFIDPLTGTATNVDVFGLTSFQFKPFNQPVPKIGFETFQGNTRSIVNNRCVRINFTNWRTTFPGGAIVNVNINSPLECNDCCVVFRTSNPA